MPRSYIRLLPDVYARKALARKANGIVYTPEQFMAFIGMLCAAEAVAPRGRFASKAVLKGMLEGDKPIRDVTEAIEFLIDQGDLVLLEDGSYYVEGWDELQEGRDPTAAQRMQRYRHRKRETRNATVGYAVRAVSSEHSVVQVEGTNGKEKNDLRAREGIQKLSDTAEFRRIKASHH